MKTIVGIFLAEITFKAGSLAKPERKETAEDDIDIYKCFIFFYSFPACEMFKVTLLTPEHFYVTERSRKKGNVHMYFCQSPGSIGT